MPASENLHITGLMHRSNISGAFPPFSFGGLYLRTKVLILSVPEGDRQFRLVRVHHEHREELGRLRLAGIGADTVAVAGSSEKLCPAL
jgi:hypothetical protein